MISYLLFSQYDEAEQLIFKSLHCHSKVDDRRLGADLGRVRRVAELSCDVEAEVGHDVHFLVTDLDLKCAARLNEVLLKDVVEGRVEILTDVLNEEWAAERQGVLQMCPEVFVVQVSYL